MDGLYGSEIIIQWDLEILRDALIQLDENLELVMDFLGVEQDSGGRIVNAIRGKR